MQSDLHLSCILRHVYENDCFEDEACDAGNEDVSCDDMMTMIVTE